MNEKRKDNPGGNKYIRPPIVAMFYIIVALLLGRFVPALAGMPPLLKNIGLGLTFAGFLFGVGAFLEIRKIRSTLDRRGSAGVLATGGVYRFTRNPVYLGFLLMVIGFPLAYGSLWGLIAAPFFITTMHRLFIEKEETYLEKKFKEQYTGYRSRVRRWI